MADFMRVFEALDRWGPGSEQDTLKALSKVPFEPVNILEIGCGKGIATRVLASHTSAHITAVDNEESALVRVNQQTAGLGVSERVETLCANMSELSVGEQTFDLIWSEGSAYIMGVTNAFRQWRPMLKGGGVLLLSDLVWLTDAPSEDAKEFWQQEYPDMTTVDSRLAQAVEAGYRVLDNFTLGKAAWSGYMEPLESRVRELRSTMPRSDALDDLERELVIYHDSLGEFSYQMFVLEKPAS